MAWTSGWRFAGLALGGSGAGPVVTPSGGIAMVTDDAAIRQSLMILLSTIPGERVMRPDYGCPLHRLVFDPNDDTTAGLAIHYVRAAVLRFEKRIDILRLDAGRIPPGETARSSEDHTLFVRLDYRVRASRRDGRIDLALDLAGGTA